MSLTIQVILMLIIAGSFGGVIWLMYKLTRLVATLNKRQTELFANVLEKYQEFLFYGTEGMKMKDDAVNSILNGNELTNDEPYDPFKEHDNVEPDLT